MFNAESTIERAIESCARQTVADLEVIVVDDSSTDTSREVVANSRDPRIRLVPLPENVGPGEARNRGLEVSRGNWLTVLDADDAYTPTRLERLLEVADTFDGKLSVLVDRWRVVAADRSPLPGPHGAGKRPTERVLTGADAVRKGISGKPFFSRTLLESSGARYPAGIRFGEDTAFLVQLLNADGATLTQLADVLYVYTYRAASLTRAPDRLDHLERSYRFLLDECDLQPDIRSAVNQRLHQIDADRDWESARRALRDRRYASLLGEVIKAPSLPVKALKRYGRHRRFQRALRKAGPSQDDGL